MEALINKLFSLISKQTGLESLPFNKGSLPAEISQVEASLKVALPDDYKTFLQHCNGQVDSSLTFPPDQLVFLSIQEVARLWNELNENPDDQTIDQFDADQKVRSVLYHAARIPIAYNESGGAYLFLDYIPGPNGKLGQIVFNTNEIDLAVVEDSFQSLIGTYVRLLEEGKMVVKKRPPEYGQGNWFVSSNDEYINWEVFQRLKGNS